MTNISDFWYKDGHCRIWKSWREYQLKMLKETHHVYTTSPVID